MASNYVLVAKTFKSFATDYRNPLDQFYVIVRETSIENIPAEDAIFVANTVEEENYIRSIFGTNIECINVITVSEYDTLWLITTYESKIFRLVFENY